MARRVRVIDRNIISAVRCHMMWWDKVKRVSYKEREKKRSWK